MKEKFFEKGNYLKDTNKLLRTVKTKIGINAFLFTRRMLLAAWYAGTKPDTEYIQYWEVLNRTKKIMEKENPTMEDIKKINYLDTTFGDSFFGVPSETILDGNINDTIIQAQEYVNKPSCDPFDDEDDDWFFNNIGEEVED